MSKHPIYQPSIKKSSLRQGEILTNVVQYCPVVTDISDQEVSFTRIIHPYAIVVTQDCDLDWDYRAMAKGSGQETKLLNSVILCVIDTAEAIRGIEDKDIMNSKEWNLVKNHRHERYYFFERIPVECELQQRGLPELTADFKRVFGITSEDLNHQIELNIAILRTLFGSGWRETRQESGLSRRV
jgi:hypothetical protein